MLLAQNTEIPLGGETGFRGSAEVFQPGDSIQTAAASFENFFSNIIGVFTVFAGMGFILYFAFGALQWILAQGDEGRTTAARKQMTNGAVGLLITVIAYVLIAVVGAVVGIDILNPATTIIERLDPNNL